VLITLGKMVSVTHAIPHAKAALVAPPTNAWGVHRNCIICYQLTPVLQLARRGWKRLVMESHYCVLILLRQLAARRV
jgi:hypothetical protein